MFFRNRRGLGHSRASSRTPRRHTGAAAAPTRLGCGQMVVVVVVVVVVIIIVNSSSNDNNSNHNSNNSSSNNNSNVIWLRTNGVNTNGAAAKVIDFDRLGEKVRPGTFGKTNKQVNESAQKVPLSQKQ